MVLLALLLFGDGGPDPYKVKIEFRNASQLVKGDAVQIGGTTGGEIEDIKLAPNGIAVVTARIDEPYVPLRLGTKATIRQTSQAGVANRYVDLQIPPGNAPQQGTIENGDTITAADTTTIVDLDQVFAIFDPDTRKSVRALFANTHKQFKGKTDEQAEFYKYLSPALSTANGVFEEVNRDSAELERFIVGSGQLVTALADRRTDLSGSVAHLNTTFRSIGDERTALAEALRALPPLMRRANTTFVDLRAALDDVDPLVEASKPVARRLPALLDQLRPLANDARPTVRDLADVIHAKGATNDLTDVTNSFPALKRIALDTAHRKAPDFGTGKKDVGNVKGAFPETTEALKDSTPIIAFGRPYTPDLVGWFDDFSTSGATDAIGGVTRVLTVVNAISPTGAVPALIPLSERGLTFDQFANTGQHNRCPGAAEVPAADGSNVYTEAEQKAMDCKEEDRATGRVTPP